MAEPHDRDDRHLAPPESSFLSTQAAAQLATDVLGVETVAHCIQRRHRNEVFALDTDLILKVYTRHGPEKLDRKLAAHSVLETTDMRVPKLIAHGRLDEDVTWTIETRVESGPRHHLHPDQHGRHFAMGRFLGELHSIPAPAMVAGGWSSAEDRRSYADRSLTFAIGRIGDRAAGADFALATMGLARARAAMDTSALWTSHSPRFVHGGFTAANCSVQPGTQEWVVESVFDFEDSHPGDPAEDFALVALYGIHDLRLKGLLEGYGSALSGESSAEFLSRVLIWTTVIALGILEWGPRLGDLKYTNQARSFLSNPFE